jgi:hypothetical protein
VRTQGADIDELQRNLREVIEMLPQGGEPNLESEMMRRPLSRHVGWTEDAVPT